jgi:rSAM/selenodomain-associated transferase 1
MTSTPCAIAVMAKAPRAGRVKTRLTPPLTPEGAMAMSAAFLRDITENMQLASRQIPIQPFVAYAPLGLESLFDGMLADGTRLVLADGDGIESPGVEGFGRCLLHAIQSLFDPGFATACLLNADSPTLPTALLAQAAAELTAPGDRVVLGPAEDGGYYLIGLKSAHAHLFADIAWSTGDVAEQTRARAREIGLETVELPAWYDVDDAASLGRLRADLAHPANGGLIPFAAPATARCLADIDQPQAIAAQ